MDPEKWKLAKAKCQKENGWAFTEYAERDKDFICPEKYNHEFNTLKFRFQAKSPMEKEVDGEWEPYYHIGCCWVNKPLTECDSSAEQCDRRKTWYKHLPSVINCNDQLQSVKKALCD